MTSKLRFRTAFYLRQQESSLEARDLDAKDQGLTPRGVFMTFVSQNRSFGDFRCLTCF